MDIIVDEIIELNGSDIVRLLLNDVIYIVVGGNQLG